MKILIEIIKDLGADILLRVLYAGIILLAGILGSRLVKRSLTSVLNHGRIANDSLIKSFFLRSVSLTIIILSVLTALSHLGFDVRTFITGLGVTGLILGFGLRDTMSNFAAGLLLLIYRPFRAGELIEVEGSQGVVIELTIVNMHMITTDGVHVIMPNSKVWGAKIINYSLSKQRRLELTLKVREEDAKEAGMAITSALSEDPRISKTPAPSVRIASISNNAATITIWAWADPADYSAACDDEYLNVLAALRRAYIPTL